MKIIVLSDTHIPRMARDIPKVIYDEIKKSDLVLHTGDFAEMSFLEKLRKLKKTVAVYGNMDSKEVSSALKTKEIVEAGKFRIGLIHGSGSPDGLTDRILEEFKIGAEAWISFDGRKALPVIVIEVNGDRGYSVRRERPPQSVHSLFRDEVRSTPELACINCVTS